MEVENWHRFVCRRWSFRWGRRCPACTQRGLSPQCVALASRTHLIISSADTGSGALPEKQSHAKINYVLHKVRSCVCWMGISALYTPLPRQPSRRQCAAFLDHRKQRVGVAASFGAFPSCPPRHPWPLMQTSCRQRNGVFLSRCVPWRIAIAMMGSFSAENTSMADRARWGQNPGSADTGTGTHAPALSSNVCSFHVIPGFWAAN